MARTAISTVLEISNQLAVISAGDRDLTYVAGDAVNGNEVASTGTELVIVKNDDASPHSVTFPTASDSFGRDADLVESIGAGEAAIFGPFPTEAWRQSDGKLYIDVDDANLELAVVRQS